MALAAVDAGRIGAEFLGTMIIILFGDGVVAMAVAALKQSDRGGQIFQASGDRLLIAWGWGFAVCFAVYVAGGVSGAHLNPAVTVAFAWRRGFAWMAGWKEIAMPGNYDNVNSYFWIPILGPIVGAGIGAAVYDGLIRSVLRARLNQEEA